MTQAQRIAVVGAGPVGLTLALLLAARTQHAHVCVYDARPLTRNMSGDGRTLALALGSMQLLQRLNAWDNARMQPIDTVHVSQQPPTLALPASLHRLGEHDGRGGRNEQNASVTLRAQDLHVPMLGAVLPYGALVAPLQRAWEAACERTPGRLSSRFGTPVSAINAVNHGRHAEVEAGESEAFDLAVVAEGGVFADQARKAVVHDYQQTAWVGTVLLSPEAGHAPGIAIERFTRHGPVALLPLPPTRDAQGQPQRRAALVWCVPTGDDPVKELNDAQRVAVLNTLFDLNAVGARIVALAAPLKTFALGLNAERTLVDGAAPIVRIGNAAQTLHPVAGQGLNLGLRDAYALAEALHTLDRLAAPHDLAGHPRASHPPSTLLRQALRRVEWQRAPDRWALIAGTDFLARSFTWGWPGFGAARGVGMALLDRLPPLKALLARQMMFGSRSI